MMSRKNTGDQAHGDCVFADADRLREHGNVSGGLVIRKSAEKIPATGKATQA